MSIRSLGDVVSRSGPCVTLREDASVVTLSKTLADGRVDAVAVLSTATSALVGIATSRDVAKCISRGENMDNTKVSQIMTVRPITLPPSESPANALSLMREGRFRHIPIVHPENASVLGIVNVLNLAYDAITRLQVSYSMIPSRRGFEFMRAARETIEKPTLRPIVERSNFATLSADHSVVEACETLVRERLAAIVIVDKNNALEGIFTCRDVASRVVAKGLNPYSTLLTQVMTKNPDSASPDYTILESLQRMQACGFRHLPVIEDNTRLVVGLVDVLQLASETLLGLQTAADDSSRALSQKPGTPYSQAAVRGRGGITSIFSSLFSNSYAQSEFVPDDRFHRIPTLQSPPRNIPSYYSHPTLSSSSRRHFSYRPSDPSSTLSSSSRGRMIPPDTPVASFKFRDINNEYRRIKVPMNLGPGAYDQFVLDVRRRFAGSHSVGSIKIKYLDEDKDEILISNDEDLESCFEDYLEMRSKTIILRVYEAEHATSSQIQSPVSSTPSSILGSPNYNLNNNRADVSSRPSRAASEDSRDNNSTTAAMKRRSSRPAILTPSQTKSAEAHKRMLDGENEEAIILYGEALKLDPDNARAQGGRGAARLFCGNSVGAEEDYRAALQLLEEGPGGAIGDLTFQMCIVGLVESLIDQRRYEEAAAAASRIDPDCGNTGCHDAFRAELDSASDAAREALEANETGDAMNCYSNAVRVETAYLKLMPSETPRASLRLGRAKCYKALEDYDMALEDYEAAVQIEPESVAGHKGCGKCLAELEQYDKALESYKKAHKLDPADEEVRSQIETIKRILPDPLQSKKAEIAKLGALLGSMKLPGKPL
ncbi:unnamed protein product [Agarophyton chilense]|eukprot:gb/GEZJ01001751.1/.p1 GENE.gb/GEZJ01001751.1/~~gb/GEZJ01001751.1/.p1  ORF type:complete len:828 (-),score=118.46 gb/GEZJ01001751.1/:7301-9784(-)